MLALSGPPVDGSVVDVLQEAEFIRWHVQGVGKEGVAGVLLPSILPACSHHRRQRLGFPLEARLMQPCKSADPRLPAEVDHLAAFDPTSAVVSGRSASLKNVSI